MFGVLRWCLPFVDDKSSCLAVAAHRAALRHNWLAPKRRKRRQMSPEMSRRERRAHAPIISRSFRFRPPHDIVVRSSKCSLADTCGVRSGVESASGFRSDPQ